MTTRGPLRSAMAQVPVVRHVFAEWVEPDDFVWIVRLAGAIRQNYELVAVSFVPVDDPGRNLDENVVVVTQKYLLKFALRRGAFASIVQYELCSSGYDRVIERHRLVDVPGLHRTGPCAREI